MKSPTSELGLSDYTFSDENHSIQEELCYTYFLPRIHFNGFYRKPRIKQLLNNLSPTLRQ